MKSPISFSPGATWSRREHAGTTFEPSSKRLLGQFPSRGPVRPSMHLRRPRLWKSALRSDLRRLGRRLRAESEPFLRVVNWRMPAPRAHVLSAVLAVVLYGAWLALTRAQFSGRARLTAWLAIAVPLFVWQSVVWWLALPARSRAEFSPLRC